MTMINRLGQTLFTLTLGLYFVLIGFSNITDYGTNFKFVQHVLSMDSIPFDSKVMWRAITAPWVHHAAYGAIIV
jgi:predicted small integral membrane protein